MVVILLCGKELVVPAEEVTLEISYWEEWEPMWTDPETGIKYICQEVEIL